MIPKLDGTGRLVLVATSLFVAIATVAFGLRVWARLLLKAWAMDDWLMLVGCHRYHDPADAHKSLTVAEYEDGMKWHFFIGLLYTVNTAIVKCSICCLMLRFAQEKIHRWIFKGVIHISLVAAFIRIIVWITRCKTLRDAWKDNAEGGGTCSSPALLTQISIFFSVVCIATDLVCAIVPVVIIHKLHTRLKQKICIDIMLSLGIVASVATIIRAQFLFRYQDTDDFLYNLAPIAFYSNFEIMLGIVAACIATMRPLTRYLLCLRTETTSCRSEGEPYSNSYEMRHISTFNGNQPEQLHEAGRSASQQMILPQHPHSAKVKDEAAGHEV